MDTKYDFQKVSPSTAVIEEVADREGVDVDAISEPLADAIDPDALDDMVESLTAKDGHGTMSFTYAGYEVTVRSSGHVDLEEHS